ncbi:hypothetical protein F5050DRAFT_1810386 [Lentinula boryana]|uniref:Uncharacterized protein n=1 Tax=Lentinula boryana TaxID=40481 RepID=A0ABQ8Q571_9AGAR|nr:hypothetical protein F5050DRAFT_1810386 [Lentinula boryana]
MVRITLLVLATFIGASAYASPIAYRPAATQFTAKLDLGRRAFAGNSKEPSQGNLDRRDFAINNIGPSQGDLKRRAFAGGHGEPLKEDLDKRAFASNGSEPSQVD